MMKQGVWNKIRLQAKIYLCVLGSDETSFLSFLINTRVHVESFINCLVNFISPSCCFAIRHNNTMKKGGKIYCVRAESKK
jgi:hypothetical protein